MRFHLLHTPDNVQRFNFLIDFSLIRTPCFGSMGSEVSPPGPINRRDRPPCLSLHLAGIGVMACYATVRLFANSLVC